MAEKDMTENNGSKNGTAPAADNEYGLTTPTAPEGGIPAWPGNTDGNTPVAPLPNPGEGGPVNSGNGSDIPVNPLPNPGEGGPVAPGNGSNIPVIPLPNPGEGGPVAPGRPQPSWPIYPVNPPAQYYGQVRFLNASTNSFPVNISIDNEPYAVNSRFATLSTYDWIGDGFHTVTVRRATGMRSILLQQTFPFVSGEKVTMVLVDSGSGGLNMIRVSDTGCRNLPYNSGCYRIANMSYAGSNYDLKLYGGETVFRSIGFQEVTSYKQAVAGSYEFYLTRANSFSVIRELPIIVIGAIAGSNMSSQPLVSFFADIQAGKKYTSYIIGNTWSDNSFRVMTVED